MIEKLETTAVHFELDDRLKRYVAKKIGKLDRYVPKNDREPLHCQVVLTEAEGQAKNRFTCEVTMHLPHIVLSAKEATINMYAAIDIVEAKIKQQLQKYKSKETDHRLHRRVWRKVRGINRNRR